MIILAKLITGEFVIGKKNEKENCIEQPYKVVPADKGFAMAEYYRGFTPKPEPIPFSCIMVPLEPRKDILDAYSNMVSPIKVVKNKIVDMSTHKNNLN